MISEEGKDRLARRMKILEEGLNSLRPFYWPVLIMQSTFWTSLKVANYLGLPEELFVGSVIAAGGALITGFVYYTYRWDIHNRMGKVDEDISGNYTSPTTIINQEVGSVKQAKGIELWSRIIHGEEEIGFEEALQEIRQPLREELREKRDGVEVENYDQ